MIEKSGENAKKHTLSASARTHAEIAGVSDVESFDEVTVILLTDCGRMTVEGDGLRVGTLDIARGVVVLDGRIDAIYYSEQAPARRGLRARLFR